MPKLHKVDLKPFSDSEQLVVGKYYNVRCAEIIKNGKSIFIPIIGHPHKDPQFGADAAHYHVDGRFATRLHVDEDGKTNDPVWIERFDYRSGGTFSNLVIVKRRKCVRLTTGVKPPLRKFYLSIEEDRNEDSKYMVWYKTMIGKSCAGKKCPHLGTTMLEQNGNLVCPLHNLRGCKETEKIINY